MMDIEDQINTIVTSFSTGLPALLTTAGLSNFESYNSGRELKSNSIELCVYADYSKDSTDRLERAFIVKAQLYGIDKSPEYFDVINKYIKSNIKPESIGFTNRDSIIADFMPADRQMTSYVFFSIIFSTELDDCEE